LPQRRHAIASNRWTISRARDAFALLLKGAECLIKRAVRVPE
jgi:hypothetical protein